MRRSIAFPLLALALGSLLAVGISAQFFPLTTRSIDLDSGAKLFNARCASCHSLTENGSNRGPSLARIGEGAASRVPGQDAEQYIFNSIVQPDAYKVSGFENAAMPLNISNGIDRDGLINLVAFLATRKGELRPRRLLALDTSQAAHRTAPPATTLSVNSIERGRALFLGKGNCSVCHQFRSVPGSDLVAPLLDKAGYSTREELMQSLREPSKTVAPGYTTWALSRDGLTISGRKLPAPDGRIRLLTVDAAGRPTVNDFAESALEPLDDDGHVTQKMDVSAMPPATQALSPEEIDCVIDFLLALK